MNDSKIETRDTVRVNFNTGQYTLCNAATVLYMPTATGDSWIFKDCDNNEIHHVSEGCTVTLIKKSVSDLV